MAEVKLQQDKLDTALQMKVNGVPVETIAKYIGHTVNEIAAL